MKRAIGIGCLVLLFVGSGQAQNLTARQKKCSADILNGNFQGKRFWISDVTMKESEIGRSLIRILTKRGARLAWPTDVMVQPWIDLGERFVEKDHGVKKVYIRAELTVFYIIYADKSKEVSVRGQKMEKGISSQLRMRVFVPIEELPKGNYENAVKHILPVLEEAVPSAPHF